MPSRGGGRQLLSPFYPHRAACFEQIGKVSRKSDFDPKALGLFVVVSDSQSLMAAAIPQEARSAHMNEIVAEKKLSTLVEQIGVRKIAGEHRIVVAQRRRQEHRPSAIDRQMQMRQVPRIAMEDAVRTFWSREKIAVMVENGEGVSVLESSRPSLLQRCGCRNEELVHRGIRACGSQ
ncbi:UNVERIFIED_ORG: hypothetical protein GGI57_005345 [Rhizobium aethiopicum]